MERCIDLTHSLSTETPCWDGSCGFNLQTALDYQDCAGDDRFRVQKISMSAGIGTHLDAPAHCFSGAATVDALNIEAFRAKCCVLNLSNNTDESFLVMPHIIEDFERKYGEIPPHAFVLIHSGWSTYWNEPHRYRNDLRFPGVHQDTAALLLEKKIVGLGIDTLSPDPGGAAFPVHRIILGAGKYLVENVANGGSLPATGAEVLVLPMKIKDGTEAPVRMVAFL